MSYTKSMVTLYAEAWLEINGLQWSEENWKKATEWVSSHSFMECAAYVKENY